METTTRVWRHLGVVETIYEEEGEDSSSSADEHSTPPLSPDQLSPSPAPLRSRMALDSGNENDVVIIVQGSSFYVQKGPLIANSNYLKRLLKESSKELTLSPPLNITPETFSLVIDYCYGSHIVITPFNVAPLRVAADLLEMAAEANCDPAGGEDLQQKTEAYLVSVHHEHTGIVLRSCVSLLPEAETAAALVSRCIEALSLTEEEEEILGYLQDVSKLRAGSFQVLVECLNQRLTSHDLLYRLVDLYLKEHNGEITEEQKIRMCNYIDCTIVSPQLLMHAVQNPIMPLRFVVQAMFLEQLNTRRTIFTAADDHHDLKQLTATTKHKEKPIKNPETLGAILQRDAALRQVAQLKANMDTTGTKIQSLEKELNDMRRLLQESDNNNNNSIRKNTHDSGRSQSFRTINSTQMNKIERDQIGSVSSASFRILNKNSRERGVVSERWYPSSEEESQWRTPARRTRADQKNLGRRLMDGLKSAFGVSNSMSKKAKEEIKDSSGSKIPGGDGGQRGEIGNGDDVVIKKDLPLHRRPAHRL